MEETLRAALADPNAALAVASGHLTRALSYAGLGEVDIEAATATPLREPAQRQRPSPQRDQDRGRDQRRAEPPAPSEPAKSKPPTKNQQEDDDTQARARKLRDAVRQARDRVEKATAARDAATAREESWRTARSGCMRSCNGSAVSSLTRPRR